MAIVKISALNSDSSFLPTEGCWANAKAKYRSMHGTSDNLFVSYLQEFMWKKQFKENFFGKKLDFFLLFCLRLKVSGQDIHLRPTLH